MLPDLRQRSTAAELMDDREIAGVELFIALRELRFINTVLLGACPRSKAWCGCGMRLDNRPRCTCWMWAQAPARPAVCCCAGPHGAG